ncbi:hypothetical protein MUCCIDRAFT_107893 [Mucor lusitanicus CBS 277.49]|uniref:Uncharacterized protein n=1 Tax=Mucor lusitanicus CBS 277.49 TaxID=747725 RepID=A0A162ZQU1_MUCCL|nr:hypothetical protein MUCCIDRAFT_107893 [Mucor lusitanicus CBS 277.49]
MNTIKLQLSKLEVHSYTTGVNETTNLMCHIRPLIIHLLRPLHLYQFQWAEAALRCKKIHENKILLSEGACTTPTKIDGIITDQDFNLEVAIIEVSGPNNKMWKPYTLKSVPSLESKASLKVYVFHIYRKSSTKVVVPMLPDLVSHLWQIRDIHEQQHAQLMDFIYAEDLAPNSSIGGSDQEEPYISPRKKQKVKQN